MPALLGTVIMTLTDDLGNPLFVVYEFYNPTTLALEDRTQSTSRGNRTGAVIIDNMTGRAQKLSVAGVGTLNVATNGDTYSAAQLASQGYNTISDLAGLTPVIV